MTYTFVINGRLAGINDYTKACRTHRQIGAKLKNNEQKTVYNYLLCASFKKKCPVFTKPVFIHYAFYEPNKKRDHDNVSGFAHKVIQDALVEFGTLQNDGWNNIIGYMDEFYCDKENPRIEVTITDSKGGIKHGGAQNVRKDDY